MKCLRRLFLGLAAAAGLAGQAQVNCTANFHFTTAGQTTSTNGCLSNSQGVIEWRMVYVNNTFSPVSIAVESAPDSSGMPGAWVTFNGTVIQGPNPATSTVQGTVRVSGYNRWVRVRAVTLTGGPGTVDGVIYGCLEPGCGQLAAAPPPFGVFVTPVASDWAFVSQANATRTDVSDGIVLRINQGSGADFLNTLCNVNTLPAPPWTVTMAWTTVWTAGGGNSRSGLTLSGTGADITEQWNAIFLGYQNQSQCSTTGAGSCTSIQANTVPISPPIMWERVIDNGSTRDWLNAVDGANFARINSGAAPATYGNIVPNKACLLAYQNDTNFQFLTKLLSYKVCPNTTGVC